MRMRMRSAPLARSTDGGQQGGGRRGRKKRKKKERADGAGACTVLYCTAATWPALHAAGGVTQKQDRSNCLLAHACLVCGDYSSQLFFAYNYGVITELLTQLVALIMCLMLCH